MLLLILMFHPSGDVFQEACSPGLFLSSCLAKTNLWLDEYPRSLLDDEASSRTPTRNRVNLISLGSRLSQRHQNTTRGNTALIKTLEPRESPLDILVFLKKSYQAENCTRKMM